MRLREIASCRSPFEPSEWLFASEHSLLVPSQPYLGFSKDTRYRMEVCEWLPLLRSAIRVFTTAAPSTVVDMYHPGHCIYLGILFDCVGRYRAVDSIGFLDCPGTAVALNRSKGDPATSISSAYFEHTAVNNLASQSIVSSIGQRLHRYS